MRRDARQYSRTEYTRFSSNECCDVGLSEFEAMSVLAGPRLRAGDGVSGLRPESCWNDCLTRRKSIRPCVPFARSLRGWSGEATDRSKPSDNVPTLARVASEPRGDDVSASTSPALANCALDGLERLLREKYPAGKRLKSLGGEKPCVNLVRYADDFVITSKSKGLLEGEIKPLVEQFLQERGLELSPKKTVITHVEHGFDFLGQNVRRYPNGKLLIKPSKKNVKTFLDGIRRTIKAAHGVSAADLIDQLNPKIRGWANYHRHVVSKRTFGHVDRNIFSSLWQWARRRHPNKSPRWFKPKYFDRRGNRDWSFFGETCDDEGRPNKVWLYYAKSTPIKRHVKVKREGAHMLETFRGTRTLRYLWYEQRGLCTQCNTKITRITGWRLHYSVPRVMGGSTGAANCVLLHPECHDRVHRQRLFVSKPRLLVRGVRRA